MNANRNISFDVARAISMFYIVGILHLSGYTVYSIGHITSFTSFIWSALGVFTFLSAFLLASKYHFESMADVMAFYRKRVARFYPLFLVSSLLLYAIDYNSLDVTIKGIFGISCFWKPQQQTLWYISTLMFLYFITPLLCSRRIGAWLRVAIFGVILGVTLGIQKVFQSVDPRFYYYYIVYFAGIICAVSFPEKTQRVLKSSKTLISLAIYVPIFIYLFFNSSRIVMMIEGYLGILVILNLSHLLYQVYRNSEKFLKAVSFVSYGSMCAYLFHREIYWGFMIPLTEFNTGG